MLEAGTDVRNSNFFPEKDQVWVWGNVPFWQIIPSRILYITVDMPVKVDRHHTQLACISSPKSYKEIPPNAECL